MKMLRKALGFRMTMNLIPLDARLVKGSHGCVPELTDNRPVLIGHFPKLRKGSRLQAMDVYHHLYEVCARSEA